MVGFNSYKVVLFSRFFSKDGIIGYNYCRNYVSCRILIKEDMMIKVIAFDLVGVLVTEREVDLTGIKKNN